MTPGSSLSSRTETKLMSNSSKAINMAAELTARICSFPLSWFISPQKENLCNIYSAILGCDSRKVLRHVPLNWKRTETDCPLVKIYSSSKNKFIPYQKKLSNEYWIKTGFHRKKQTDNFKGMSARLKYSHVSHYKLKWPAFFELCLWTCFKEVH